jgi:glycosyltransferase involved in cell wall biosynthesis
VRVGTFVLNCPVFDDGSQLLFGDECHRHTIEVCRPFLDEVSVIARRRAADRSDTPRTQSRLEDVGARFVLELPDFGKGRLAGWAECISLLMNPKYMQRLREVMSKSDFIYTDAPALEAFMAARAAHQLDRFLVMEMRAETILNRKYMRQRFGLPGPVYAAVFDHMFSVVRRQSLAGLYISDSLRDRFPVAGGYQEVISDVHLIDEAFGQPRHFATVARRFLYVGHLERVKRVDWILLALWRVREYLPEDWVFDVVGDGPEQNVLGRLAYNLGIQDHVKFHGRLKWGAPIFEIYQSADLLLMASLTEGASRAMLEAMAAGLPVLSTAVGEARELLDPQAVSALDDVEVYSRHLAGIATNRAMLTRLSRQNWQRSQDYRYSKLISRRKEFYARAIGLRKFAIAPQNATARR